MLDTLLQIGKTFRLAKRLQHHRYIKPAPLPDKRTEIRYLSLPVREDFSFAFDELSDIPENEYWQLYYPTFKTGEADGMVKYVFGDICYGLDKDGKELGYYRMGDKENKAKGFQVSSFHRGKADSEFFKGTAIEKFRQNFEGNLERIESLLKETVTSQDKRSQFVILHFEFSGSHWYSFEKEMNLINEKLFQDVLSYSDKAKGYILKAFLYKTLSSGNTPNFESGADYKNKLFASTEDVLDLVYSIDYSKKAIISERNIKLVILPRGKNLSAEQIEDFFEKKSALEDEKVEQAEEKLKQANKPDETVNSVDFFDSLFQPILTDVSENITQYDFIFSKRADSPSTPDVDMIEISGIERSALSEVSHHIKFVRNELLNIRNRLYPKRPKNFIFLDIRKAFLNLLGDMTKAQKKYQNHLFKVLPQIYSNTYYQDPILLPAFIEKTEFNIRNDSENYNLLKYDYYFLTRIQTNGNMKLQTMENSPSYQAGLLLGKMAQPLNRAINSFEKNYVGLLSRRISDKAALIKFANFINEKLAIHDVAYPNLKEAYSEFAALIAVLPQSQYDKHHCAFGFFESYFKRYEKKSSVIGAEATESQPDTSTSTSSQG